MNKIRDSLSYSFHVIFHPFDGFWCAQRAGKGDPRAATIIIALVTMVYILSKQLTGFIFNTEIDQDFNLFSELLGVIVPVLLWCVANWSITTLMDGEGSFKDIYIATAYSLVPLILINVPMIILSRIIVQEEQQDISGSGNFSSSMDRFFNIQRINDNPSAYRNQNRCYHINRSGSNGGNAVLFLLSFALIQQLINFVYMFYKEMTLRLY